MATHQVAVFDSPEGGIGGSGGAGAGAGPGLGPEPGCSHCDSVTAEFWMDTSKAAMALDIAAKRSGSCALRSCVSVGSDTYSYVTHARVARTHARTTAHVGPGAQLTTGTPATSKGAGGGTKRDLRGCRAAATSGRACCRGAASSCTGPCPGWRSASTRCRSRPPMNHPRT
jgi:hypothetical protein